MQALPMSRNGSLFSGGAANDSDRVKSYLIIEVYFIKKALELFKTTTFDLFFFLFKGRVVLSLRPPYFLGHSMHAGPCV